MKNKSYECQELINEFQENQDVINHPSHYTQGNIEVWDFIVDQGLDYLEGNVVKYVCRHRYKNGLEDLKKAKQYIEKLITKYEQGK